MEIETNFTPITPKSGLVGFITFILDGILTISGIAAYKRRKMTNDKPPYRLTYPTRKSGGNEYKITYPNNTKFSNLLENKANDEIKKYFEGWSKYDEN